MNVLSLHSSVALGSVGNSGAAFALRRLGHAVWPIDTVVLSNHPGHGGFRGRSMPPEQMAELVEGLAERGALGRCDPILTGYLGAAEQGPVILDAVARVRRANPKALWLVDPVIGDGHGAGGRIYVKPGIAEWLRDRARPRADILTPNGFELAFLSERTPETTEAALDAARALRAETTRPACAVVATGLRLRDAPAGVLTLLAVDAEGAWRATVQRAEHPAHGAGDVFAALLLGRTLSGEPLPRALGASAASVSGLIARTDPADPDLALVAAQDEIATPRVTVAVERLT